MRKLILAATAVLAMAAAATPAAAWNGRGHMLVAAVAWDSMTPEARAEAGRLLKLNPAYATWTAGVPASRQDQTAFIKAAAWPDDIRSAYTMDGYDPVEPIASQNLGYSDRYVHGYWHFANAPYAPTGAAVPTPPEVNAVSRIKVFSDALTTSDSDDVRSYDLTWLIHLVGDIHQPLHSTSRYLADNKGDSGGNFVKVCFQVCQAKDADNLHSIWDNALGKPRDIASVLDTAEGLPKAPDEPAAISDPDVWFQESADLARSAGYVEPVENGMGPYVLTASYRNRVVSVAQKRIELAGVRLANLLNARLVKPAVDAPLK
jgi:hypothetical protein